METTQTHVDAIEKTIHTTNVWIKEMEEALEWPDRHVAFQALRASLHALRDRLTLQESANLAGQLPTLIRGLFYEGFNPSHVPVKDRHKEEFLARVSANFPKEIGADPERLCRAAFQVIRRHVSEGELLHIQTGFPKDLRDLWESPAAVPGM